MKKKIYEIPLVKVVNLKPASLICASPPVVPVEPDEEMGEDEDFE